MEKLEFIPPNSWEAADYLMIYNFNIGGGSTEIMSYPDVAFGGHGVMSETSYSQKTQAALRE